MKRYTSHQKHDLTRRDFIKNAYLTTASLALAGQIGCAVTGTQHTAARKPNVILVMTDDQGYGDIGCLGNSDINTPNLDHLHKQSLRLTNFHVDPTCSPTRSALLTGRYSSRTGVWHTIMGRSLLHKDEITMADLFASSGYQTAIFGKWHLGDNYPFRPQDKGFQEVLVHGCGGVGQTPDYF
ncbi:MAG: sulfatase-like hydrolase/transferase, partial [Planctomycetes bacterium]|nr:sulfatase-like hydrolase/transferase [Planctomycetota bacterium]